MSVMRMLLATATSVLFALNPCCGETPKQLDDGYHAPSPGGKLIVFYRVPYIEIHDRHTETVRARTETLPVEALRWAPDSKTLAVVHHIAHGSDAFFLHFGGRAWQAFWANPLEDRDYRGFTVVDIQFRTETIDISYKTYIPTRLVSFTISLSSHRASRLHYEDMSFRRWQQTPEFALRYAKSI